MTRVILPDTSIETSQLGLGCVNLTMHDDRRKAFEILEAALDMGITHFDVARLYGFGQAEGILGEFLAGKRDKVTITTKFGLLPPAGLAKHRRLVSFVRKLSHRFKFVTKLVHRVRVTEMKKAFTAADAEASLTTSLRELKTDYVDIFQIHEPDPASMQDADLVAFLDKQKQAGSIREYGVGIAYPVLRQDANVVPASFKVLQFDSSACDHNLERLANRQGRALITYSVIRHTKELAAAAKASPRLLAEWRDKVNADLTDPGTIAALMLRHAVQVNPSGVTLFATTRINNLRNNIKGFHELSTTPQQLDAFAGFASAALESAAG